MVNIQKQGAKMQIKIHSAESGHLKQGTSMRGFDTLIYLVGGAILGSSAVGILAYFSLVADGDVSRMTGIAIGAIVVGVLRFKKIF